MITLVRDGIVMEVASELQASVFLRSGYVRVEKAPAIEKPERNFATETAKETAPKAEPEPEAPVEETAKPKRTRRKSQ